MNNRRKLWSIFGPGDRSLPIGTGLFCLAMEQLAFPGNPAESR